MDNRTRILAIIFGSVVGVIFLSRTIYPTWIQPLLKLDDTIVEKEIELDKLLAEQEKIDRLKSKYMDLAARTGSFRWNAVKAEVQQHLNRLIEKHRIGDSRLEAPRSTRLDRKTKLEELRFTVNGIATAEDSVLFLRETAELPFVIRVEDVKLSPIRATSRNPSDKMLEVRTTINVMVLPQQEKIFERKIDEKNFHKPDFHIRHTNAEYARIWEAKPFWDYEPPPRPPVTQPIKPVDTPTVVVNTPKEPEKPKPPPKKDPRWPDRAKRELVWIGMTGGEGELRGECMVAESGKKGIGQQYFAIGDEFDGGLLMFVHQSGVLVERESKYFIYPLGSKLNQDVEVDNASEDYRALKRAHQLILASSKAEAEEEAVRKSAIAASQMPENTKTDAATNSLTGKGKVAGVAQQPPAVTVLEGVPIEDPDAFLAALQKELNADGQGVGPDGQYRPITWEDLAKVLESAKEEVGQDMAKPVTDPTKVEPSKTDGPASADEANKSPTSPIKKAVKQKKPAKPVTQQPASGGEGDQPKP